MQTATHPLDSNARTRKKMQPSLLVLAVIAAIGHLPGAYASPSPSPTPTPSPSPAPSPNPAPPAAAGPQEVQFSASFLGANSDAYNLSSYERGNPVLAGDYAVDLYVNGFAVGRETVSFRVPAAGGQAQACIDQKVLTLAGVDTAKLVATGVNLDGCVDLAAAINAATVAYDTSVLRLDISIPQIALSRRPRDYVDPSLWDRGINAFTLSYSFNANHGIHGDGGKSDSFYLGLNSGLNLGGWRIRNQSSYRWDDTSGSDFQNVLTYAQHDITHWQSQLTLGDSFTGSQLFENMAYRGVNLATDQRMRPDSTNGYAPTVRGTAESNAKVEIRQQGYVIYETTVSPGAFEINDLYPNNIGGDLEVVITEADGRIKSFTVPYASVPQLLRPGVWNYSATVGQLRDSSLTGDKPVFVEGTFQKGINNWLTAFVGGQTTKGNMYGSVLVGAAFNTPAGAVSMDVTGSRANFGATDDTRKGYSTRITYNKNIPATRTDFALATYRYSTANYLTLAEAAQWDDVYSSNDEVRIEAAEANQRRRRGEFRLTVSQRLGERGGSLFFSGSRNDYWGTSTHKSIPTDYSYQAGWNRSFRTANLSINASRTRLSTGDFDNSVYVNLSVPLGRESRRARAPQLSLSGSQTSSSGYGMQASLTGSAGDRSQFNYGVNTSFGANSPTSLGANASWRAPYATVGGSYTRGDTSQSASLSASGGLVVHGGGVTFASQLGETIAIIKAKGAKGARLNSDNTSKVDGRGYVVTNNLMPYRMNEVNLDPKGSSLDVELLETRRQLAPRAGAVVALEFGTTTGRATLLQAMLEDGRALPFATSIKSQYGKQLGVVGQGGRTYVRDSEADSFWIAELASGATCRLEKPSPDTGGSEELKIVNAVCKDYRSK